MEGNWDKELLDFYLLLLILYFVDFPVYHYLFASSVLLAIMSLVPGTWSDT